MSKKFSCLVFLLIMLSFIYNCAPVYDWEAYENSRQAPNSSLKDNPENAESGAQLPENKNDLPANLKLEISPEEELELIINEYSNLGQPVPSEIRQKAQRLASDRVSQSQNIHSRIDNIDIQKSENKIKFVIHTNALPEYEANILKGSERYRIYVDFYGTRLSNLTQKQKIDHELIYQLRTGQYKSDIARVVVDARQEIPYRVYADKGSNSIVLEIDAISRRKQYRHESSEPPAFIELPELKPYRRNEMGLAQELGLRIKRIIIDAGHGGTAPGAVGPTGVQEQDVVYDIAVRLKSLLRQSGEFEAYLTRDYHENPPLIERTQFANYMHGDLFISIHANANHNRDKNGIETYYLALATDDESRFVAASENNTSEIEYNNLSVLLEDILKNSKTRESAHLAQTVQSHLISQTGLEDRGVRHAGFMVLIGAQMPSILAEVGFISNPEEEQKLASENYRQTIANSLFQGIQAYAKAAATVTASIEYGDR